MKNAIAVVLLSLLAACYGCGSSAVLMGSQTVGIESGKFIYTNGAVKCDYTYPFEKVWEASVKAISDMKAASVTKEKRISKGEIEALISNEKDKVTVSYSSRDMTSVSVRVGLMGNNIASKMILERITENLKSPPPA
jgi:hypothetical protein